MGMTYKEAGVDAEAGDALVEQIKPLAKRTYRPEVLAGVGGFGGLFAVPVGKYKEPVLVSGTDGVGTKLKLAFSADKHETVGIDLVAMSVNDVITCGAEPLFFLDYFATSKLEIEQAKKVIGGIAKGCEEAGCALLGGETAELPGFYRDREYDLNGFCVGIVERAKILDPQRIAPGDALIGLGSSGIHSNGFSMVRKVLFEQHQLAFSHIPPGYKRRLDDVLLEPTRIYVKPLAELMAAVEVKGLAHITGGGIPGNLPRCLPDNTVATLEERAWKRPPIFDFIAELGKVERAEMFHTFNMGLGMVAVVPAAHAPAAIRTLKQEGVEAWEVGVIEKGQGEAKAVIVP